MYSGNRSDLQPRQAKYLTHPPNFNECRGEECNEADVRL